MPYSWSCHCDRINRSISVYTGMLYSALFDSHVSKRKQSQLPRRHDLKSNPALKKQKQNSKEKLFFIQYYFNWLLPTYWNRFLKPFFLSLICLALAERLCFKRIIFVMSNWFPSCEIRNHNDIYIICWCRTELVFMFKYIIMD